MAKITLPIGKVQSGGDMFAWWYNNAILNSSNSNTAGDINAITEGDDFNLSVSDVGAIVVTNGGEVEEYLMAVRAPIAILDIAVPEGLPNREQFDGNELTFRYWLERGVEAWVSEDGTEIIFYTNPFAGNKSEYMTGSELYILHSISGASVITVEDAELETSTWTKI